MPNIRIYIAYHKASVLVESPCLFPIHVGKRLSELPIGIPGDDEGASISHKNRTFCELTAIYWAWMNDQTSDYIGLMHYRRFLDFSGATGRRLSPWGTIDVSDIDDNFIPEFGLTCESLERVVSSYDIALPRPWDVRSQGFSSLYDEYAAAADHFARDLDGVEYVIRDLFPEYTASYIKVVKQGSAGYFTNVFLMRRDIFHNYCQWLFGVLFELEKRLDISTYTPAAQRVFGYIAERLCAVYVDRLKALDPKVRIGLVDRVWVANTSVDQSPAEIPSRTRTRRVLWWFWQPLPLPIKKCLLPMRHYLKQRLL